MKTMINKLKMYFSLANGSAILKSNFFLLVLFLAISSGVKAQNAKKDETGNYVAIAKVHEKDEGKPTGKTFTDGKGLKYPVMESKTGKLFYIRMSKAGSPYRVYLKL